MTRGELDTLQAILHHVGCYNQRQIDGVDAQRLPVTVGYVPGTTVLAVAPGDLILNGVEYRPARGKSA